MARVKSLSRVARVAAAAAAAAGLACSGPCRVPGGGVLLLGGPNRQPRCQAQTRDACSPSPSLPVPSCRRLSQNGVLRVSRLTFEGKCRSQFSLLILISHPAGTPARVIPPGMRGRRRVSRDAAHTPTHAQTRIESRSREETGKERSGCFKLIPVAQKQRCSREGSAGGSPGLRPPGFAGAPGACAVRPQPRTPLPRCLF